MREEFLEFLRRTNYSDELKKIEMLGELYPGNFSLEEVIEIATKFTLVREAALKLNLLTQSK